ncbi:MAG TPA: hypothetical protein VKS81_09395 [Bacteroidota bacterium]|nr:hypothetical protein [Bacteroidota bacterium]
MIVTFHFNIRSFLVQLLLFVATVSLLPAQDSSRDVWNEIYKGRIGHSPAVLTVYSEHMNFESAHGLIGKPITGYYYFVGTSQDLPISGSSENNGTFKFTHRDSSGRILSRFVGAFPESDPMHRFGNRELSIYEMEGKYFSGNDSAGISFYLKYESGTPSLGNNNWYSLIGVSSEREFERNVRQFQDAVIKGDKETVASFMSYPITVGTKPHQKGERIRNSKSFLAAYDRIFTKSYVLKITEADTHHMFVNYQGAMIGNGEVWFNEKARVITLNSANDE